MLCVIEYCSRSAVVSLDAIADGEGDRLSHCSADSSSEANGEEHTMFSHGLIVGDKKGCQLSTGNAHNAHTAYTHSHSYKQLVCTPPALVLFTI